MVHHNCRDLWSLVCPPPGGPLTLTWSTPVCGPWLLKVVGLLYDLLVIAPNRGAKGADRLGPIRQARPYDPAVDEPYPAGQAG